MIAVYGLIFWAMWAYRKRGEAVPAQVAYNLPVEVLYTVIPTIIVGFLFYFTARDQTYIDKLDKKPDCTVNVVGFQWAWQFNYTDCGTATGLSIVGRPGVTQAQGGELSHLYLPEGKVVRFVETSPDVIHSWFVPEFLFKRDVIPGRANSFEVTIRKTGTFLGRCAEFCGEKHDRMNFYLKVVSQEEFADYMDKLKANPDAQIGEGAGQAIPTSPEYGLVTESDNAEGEGGK
jgi:cytochrome c oxidase subunit 2